MQRPAPIERCEICAEIADRALDGQGEVFQDASAAFLKHAVEKHPAEVLGVLAERYGPIFLARRQLR